MNTSKGASFCAELEIFDAIGREGRPFFHCEREGCGVTAEREPSGVCIRGRCLLADVEMQPVQEVPLPLS